MAKYRKKPVVVEAVQFNIQTGDIQRGVYWEKAKKAYYVITIHNQRAYLKDDDWIIPESDGEHHYPCRPDIFEQTYEKVKE